MPTNKEKILQFIKEETSRNIQEQSYTFEKCNAQIISMELFLDRANVSRVLNEFHKSGKLIKKTGRPTTYISRDVLSAIFPFASFPEILDKEESITDYFSQKKASPEPSITRSFSIVGSGQGGSLYELIHQILPVFYLPQNFLKIIVLQGEAGTGKKYFLRKILERAKQLYATRPDSQIYFSDFHTLSGGLYETLSNIEKNASLYILSIELPPSSAKEEIQQFLQSAELYYENQDNAPIFAFCIPNNFDVSVFYAMTSIVLKFPGLKERPQTEVIQIILNTIQQESLRLAKKISVSSRLIQSLASNSQNFHQLNQEILYAISKGVIASHRNGELHNIHLDSSYLSYFFQNAPGSADPYTFRHFPDIVTLSPDSPFDFSEGGIPFDKTQLSKTTSSNLPDLLLQDFLLCGSAKPTKPTGSYTNDRFHSEMEQLLHKTSFSSDPALCHHVCAHIVSVLNGTTKIQKLTLEALNDLPDSDSLSLTEKIHQIADANHRSFSKNEEIYISRFISCCLKMLKDISIPIIITSRQVRLAQNYSASFNLYYGQRWIHIFPIPEDSSKKMDRSYLDDLYQFALTINRGQGILILADENIKNMISNHFYKKTKLMIYCIPLHSFLILEDTVNLLSQKNRNLFSAIPNLLISQQNELSTLKGNHLNRTALRAADPHLLFAAKLFPGLQSVTINECFFRALKNILKRLEIEVTNNRVYGFLFHANCLLFQKKYQLSFYNHIPSSEASKTDWNLFQLIKECISNVPELTKYQFEETDYEILYQALVHSGI